MEQIDCQCNNEQEGYPLTWRKAAKVAKETMLRSTSVLLIYTTGSISIVQTNHAVLGELGASVRPSFWPLRDTGNGPFLRISV